MESNSCYFADLRFDQMQQDDLIEQIFSVKNQFLMVITPNVDHIVRLEKKPELKQLYLSADYCVNDSRILKLLTNLIGINLGPVMPGSDLTEKIITLISGKDVPVTIIGTSGKTIEFLKEKYNLSNISHYNPPMGFIERKEEVNKCVRFLIAHPAKFIFISVGSPQQEILALKAKASGVKGVALCIGASLLFLSGEEKRAPVFMQKLALEWLFRLLHSPKRLARRYLIDALKIFPILWKEHKKINKVKM